MQTIANENGNSPNAHSPVNNGSAFQLGNFAIDEPRRMKGKSSTTFAQRRESEVQCSRRHWCRVLWYHRGNSVSMTAQQSEVIPNVSSSFRQHIQNLDLKIYEATTGVGGTWFTHNYPGLACDSEFSKALLRHVPN